MSARRTCRTAVLGLTVAALTTAGPGLAPAAAHTPAPYEQVVDAGALDPVPASPAASRAGHSQLTVLGTEYAVTAEVSDPVPLRRDEVTVTGAGFAPEERVTASLPSRNRGELGVAVADAEGSVAITFPVPAALPEGDQEVLLTGTSGAQAGTGFALRPPLQDLLVRLVRWWPGS